MLHSCSRNCQHVEENNSGQWNLHMKINKDALQCFNEKHDGSARAIFRPWDERLDRSKVVESDDDPELLFSIPFNGNVKITGLCVIGENGPSHPNLVKLWSNSAELRFDNARGKAHQEIPLTYDPTGTLAYQISPAHFSRVTHLSLYFPTNFGEETTRINYIGLRGEFLGEIKSQVVIATYEARPQLKDHQVGDYLTGSRQIE